MKKFIKKILRKIFWLLLPLIKENCMCKGVDELIEKKVIGDIRIISDYTLRLKTIQNGTPLSSTYVVELPDRKTLTFKIKCNDRRVEFYFIETTISHLGDLKTILNELTSKLELEKNNILEIFIQGNK